MIFMIDRETRHKDDASHKTTSQQHVNSAFRGRLAQASYFQKTISSLALWTALAKLFSQLHAVNDELGVDSFESIA
jgi:hypothetical protein